MNLRHSSLYALAALVILGSWLAWRWQPERQVAHHQRSLLDAVERRNWNKVAGFMDPHYTDQWAPDKDSALGIANQVFQQFLFLTIKTDNEQYTIAEGKAHVAAKIRVSGQGGPLAQLAMERVNALQAPFGFDWVHGASWKPWDWKLVRVEQPELKGEALQF